MEIHHNSYQSIAVTLDISKYKINIAYNLQYNLIKMT